MNRRLGRRISMKQISKFPCQLKPILTAGILYASLVVGSRAAEVAAAAPKVFCDDPATLVASKAALTAGDAALKPALTHLLTEADKHLEQKASSVMDKKQVPPSGDKHDFVSQAPYF